MKPMLFLVCGLPGAGKTTFAKAFAQANNFKYISIDDCYADLNGDETDHSNKFQAWILFYSRINLCQAMNEHVVAEAMSLDHYARHEFISWFPSFSHHLILITNDFEECCRNVALRRRNISREGMLELKDRCRYPDINEQREWDSGIQVVAPTNFVMDLVGTKDFFNHNLLKGVTP